MWIPLEFLQIIHGTIYIYIYDSWQDFGTGQLPVFSKKKVPFMVKKGTKNVTFFD